LEPIDRLPGRNRTKADILVYRHGDARVALKDYGDRSALIRQTLGRWLIRRETKAYRAAGVLDGLPRFFGRIGPYALALEWIEARPLSGFDDESPPPEWRDRAGAILDRLHARGIALADLHHRDLLVSAEGHVHVVDLATAWVLGPRPGRLNRFLFERLRQLDRLALARIEARLDGRDPDEVVARAASPVAAWYRGARRIRRVLDRMRSR
jgi:hypothetical protein